MLGTLLVLGLLLVLWVPAATQAAASPADAILDSLEAWKATLPIDHGRAIDALSKRSDAQMDRMFAVFQRLPAGSEKDRMDHLHEVVNQLSWAYQAPALDPAAYGNLLDGLTDLAARGVPDARAQQVWIAKALDAIDEAQATRLPAVSMADLPWSQSFDHSGRALDFDAAFQATRTQIRRLSDANDFAGLDHLADELRRGGKHRIAGRWLLRDFYRSVTEAAREDDPVRQTTVPTIQQRRLQLEAWRRAAPSSTAARIALAVLIRSEAWLVRGQGFIDKVPIDRRIRFSRLVSEAQSVVADIDPKTDSGLAELAIELQLDSGWRFTVRSRAGSRSW